MSGDFNGVTRAGSGGAVRRGRLRRRQAHGWPEDRGEVEFADCLQRGTGRVALGLTGLTGAICVGWRLIELPGLLLLVVEVGFEPERGAAWRGFERGCTRG